uniref:Ammonium transporter AmtB-like domain-containing protein n=1 Tax=Ananas comosus var. bracteatus TaxID=296719 RepID=A0A6V7Q1H5_ANACO|nr:unnamed protein product [Ananas comosus var. bracteatus]
MASAVAAAYQNSSSSPEWLNKGDNAWQMTSATLVGLQSMPGLVILYGSIVKKKWAINSAFMALYAFAAVWLCWVTWAYNMSFGDKLLPFWGKARPALDQKFLIAQSTLPASTHYYRGGQAVETPMVAPFYPAASMVYFQCVFAAITVILLAGSLLGRMSFLAWMAFVPLWITFSYTIGAFSIWGGGFCSNGGDRLLGGYVIHVSSGIAGITAAYWGAVPAEQRAAAAGGGGLLWMGWTGFNGGDPYSANIDSSMAVLNTHVCAATSLLMWTVLDVIVFGKPSVIGAIQGMITGLVCITPGAGVVQGWAAIVMGVLSGSVPWFTMNVIHRHCTGLFAEQTLCNLFLPVTNSHGAVYGGVGGSQLGKQIAGALFIIGWNVVVTSIICLVIKLVVPLRIPDDQLLIGDDAVHGEEAYALWGDGEKLDTTRSGEDNTEHSAFAVGVTQNV